jgi:hypothetical protein
MQTKADSAGASAKCYRGQRTTPTCVRASPLRWTVEPSGPRALYSLNTGSDMELDEETFRQLRRLAPVLDDILNAGEVEHADQAVNLAALAQLCLTLSDAYCSLHPDETAQASLDVHGVEKSQSGRI